MIAAISPMASITVAQTVGTNLTGNFTAELIAATNPTGDSIAVEKTTKALPLEVAETAATNPMAGSTVARIAGINPTDNFTAERIVATNPTDDFIAGVTARTSPMENSTAMETITKDSRSDKTLGSSLGVPFQIELRE